MTQYGSDPGSRLDDAPNEGRTYWPRVAAAGRLSRRTLTFLPGGWADFEAVNVAAFGAADFPYGSFPSANSVQPASSVIVR